MAIKTVLWRVEDLYKNRPPNLLGGYLIWKENILKRGDRCPRTYIIRGILSAVNEWVMRVGDLASQGTLKPFFQRCIGRFLITYQLISQGGLFAFMTLRRY